MTAVPSLTRKQLEYSFLGLILALALFMRLDNLHSVQRWTGDQCYFYTMVMNWFHDGDWPLLGVYRSIHGDRSLGPGFYYLIAPAMWLGKCSPASGAVTIVFLSIGVIFLYWFWVRRTTGSALAALATAALFACSEGWVAADRVLWNPNTIPYSVAALACLIEGLRRRPLPSLALFLMLAAVMPQWHTTGIPVLAAAALPAAWALWQGRAALKTYSRRAWLGWSSALALVIIALYLPPILYEFKPGVPSNLRHYIANSFLPAPAQRPPLSARIADASRRVVKMIADQNFVARLRPSREPAARLIAAAALALFALVGGLTWWRQGRAAPPSVLFLACVVGGFWLVAIQAGPKSQDYYYYPMLGAPVLLLGWMAGSLLHWEVPRPAPRRAARAVGVLLVAAGLAAAATQLPGAWQVRNGRVSYGFHFRDSQKIIRYIVDDAHGRPFSMLTTDPPGNSTAYMHVLLRAMGTRSANSLPGMSLRAPSKRHTLGEALYLVGRGDPLNKRPEIVGPPFTLGKPVRVADAWVLRVPVASLPPEAQAAVLTCQAPKWFLKLEAK